jgi:Protein of unknown function (DUF1778)
MPHAQTRKMATVSINIRAKARQRDLIDQAADRLGRSRSDFILLGSDPYYSHPTKNGRFMGRPLSQFFDRIVPLNRLA